MPDDTLQALATAGTAWRATQPAQGKGKQLPQHLKQRAVDLLNQHSAKDIARALMVSDPRLVQGWQHRHRRTPTRSGHLDKPALLAHPQFVEVALPSTSPLATQAAQADKMQLELEGRGGVALRLIGSLDTELVLSLARMVVRGAGVRP